MGLETISKSLQQGVTYIGWGLTPEEFIKYYNKQEFGIKNIKLSDKVKIEFTQKRDPLVLNKNQIERLTRRNSKVIFSQLSKSGHPGCITIKGIGYDCKSNNNMDELVYGTLTPTANFYWNDIIGSYAYMPAESYYTKGNNFFPVIYDKKETYFIQAMFDIRPPGFWTCFSLIPPVDYSEVRGINISGGKRKTRHNRKYKNKKTKKMRKTKKSRK